MEVIRYFKHIEAKPLVIPDEEFDKITIERNSNDISKGFYTIILWKKKKHHS